MLSKRGITAACRWRQATTGRQQLQLQIKAEHRRRFYEKAESGIHPFLVENITWSPCAWCNIRWFSLTTADEQSSKWNPVTHHLWWFTQQDATVAPHWPAVEFKRQAVNHNGNDDANVSSWVTSEGMMTSLDETKWQHEEINNPAYFLVRMNLCHLDFTLLLPVLPARRGSVSHYNRVMFRKTQSCSLIKTWKIKSDRPIVIRWNYHFTAAPVKRAILKLEKIENDVTITELFVLLFQPSASWCRCHEHWDGQFYHLRVGLLPEFPKKANISESSQAWCLMMSSAAFLWNCWICVDEGWTLNRG